MKFQFNIFLLCAALNLFIAKSYALTDYQIRNQCRREIKKLTCIKNLKTKKINLIEGKQIEIPVIPYKNK
tara:strand:- start:559 stop:768 length:210 start_codon:yes stop_codon:yes gene_type:complete